MNEIDSPLQFNRLPFEERFRLVSYCLARYRQTKTVQPYGTSYGLKHEFERVGFYVTNGAFKGALLVAGFAPADQREQNWRFRMRPRKLWPEARRRR